MKRISGLLVVAAIAVGGCSGDRIAGPGLDGFLGGPGALELRVSVPDARVGALFLKIGGGPIDSVSAVGLDAVALSTGESAALVVRGALRNEATVRVWIPQLSRQSHYFASVVDAIDRTTYEQRPVTGYRVRITSQRTRSTRRRGA